MATEGNNPVENDPVIYVVIHWEQDEDELFHFRKTKRATSPPFTLIPGYTRILYNKERKQYENALIVSVSDSERLATRWAMKYRIDQLARSDFKIKIQEVPVYKEEREINDQEVPLSVEPEEDIIIKEDSDFDFY